MGIFMYEDTYILDLKKAIIGNMFGFVVLLQLEVFASNRLNILPNFINDRPIPSNCYRIYLLCILLDGFVAVNRILIKEFFIQLNNK